MSAKAAAGAAKKAAPKVAKKAAAAAASVAAAATASVTRLPVDLPLVDNIAKFLICASMAVFALSILKEGAYGKHIADEKPVWWWPHIPARLSWIVMEAPSPILATYTFWRAGGWSGVANNAAPFVLYTLFLTHYIYRAFIYPFLLRNSHPYPLAYTSMALSFTAVNGFIQGSYLGAAGSGQLSAPLTPVTNMRFAVGVLLWIVGFACNCHSDHLLRNLRRPGETGYKIPRGGVFEYVSGANFLGEMVEWSGFALACGGLPSLSFALFTIANIGPRAYKAHEWYIERFGSKYPADRKAVIPFVL